MLQRRSLRQVGSRLALFAVWLQIVLTLGHIHPWNIYLYGHPVVQGHGPTEIVADRHATPVPIAPQQENEAADQACSICANMALVGALVLPDHLGLQPPSASPERVVAVTAPLALTRRAFLLFQTRAPPLA